MLAKRFSLIMIALSLLATGLPPGATPVRAADGIKTMQEYVDQQGFYTPTDTFLKELIDQNRQAFDTERDLAVKYAPMAGADPGLVVWWTFVETKPPFSPYVYNNCENESDFAPDFVCGSDNWQIAYGQQFATAYNQLVSAYRAVYGNPDDKTKVQQVLQNVMSKSGIKGTAPATYTVGDLQRGAGSGGTRKWALVLSRDPGISVYLLATALVGFDRAQAFGYGPYYQSNWQNFSNGLNDVIQAWGTPSSPGPAGGGTTWGPTEPPIELEVPDCPGIVRKIDASHLPPSIYPKPTCTSGGTVTAPIQVGDLGQPTGEFGTGLGAPEAGTLFWAITGGKVYAISQGYGLTDFGAGNPDYAYCDDYGTPGHCGVDVDTPMGTQVFTPVPGRVICAGTNVTVDSAIDACVAFDSDAGVVGERGRFQIELANGDMLIFGHMMKITVKPGQQLQAGEAIGLTGTAGTGPHFHLEYRHRVGGGWTTYDPREIFNVQADGSKPSPTPLAQIAPDSRVAAATDTTATMQALMDKYGFAEPTGASGLDFAKDATNFGIERDLAIKYAPVFGLPPEMIVWWTWAETNGDHGSYMYSNCGDQTHDVDINCSILSDQGVISWQLGYGQQFAFITTGNLLKKAFEAAYGDSGNTATVQKVGQNVLAKSSITKTFPALTVDQIIAGTSNTVATPMNYWAYTLGRDPAISAYLVGAAIKSDLDGQPGKLYRDIAFGWGPWYRDNWSFYSNVMNDVVNNWDIAPGSGVGVGSCAPSTGNPSGSCSTIADSLQGMTAQEFTDKVNALMADFKKIAACGNVPWQMMAAISFREVGLDSSYRGPGAGGALGPWQIDPTGPLFGQVDPYDFVEAGCAVAKVELQEKAQTGPVGRPLRPDMDPDAHDDEVSIKDAFFAYNGRGGWEGNVAKGCTPGIDGHDDWNFDCSAYVMNNWDENHRDMCINGTFCDGNDGTWKVFYKLFHSTYDAGGKILVYGGDCNLATGVVNGIALPTAANIAITSHFFEPQGGGNYHIGIDIGNLEGAPVFAIADGDIVNSGWDSLGGYYVLQHVPANTAGNSAERWVYYGHLDPTGFPARGSLVKAGQQIGKTGPHLVMRDGVEVPNGSQTAPHLHFDIRTTTSGAMDASIHVNPCSMDQFKQGYPGLDCGTYGSQGATWK